MTWLNRLKKRYKNDRFFDEVFNTEIYKFAREMAEQSKIDTVVDVGAGAGEFSFYMYNLVEHIYAIEPEPRVYAELEDNINEFKLWKIKPFRLALSNKNGRTNLNIHSRGGHALAKEKTDKSIKVPCKTLATFIKENKIKKIDIFKTDAENAEDLFFFQSDFEFVAPRIKYIIGEHLAAASDTLVACGFEKRIEEVYVRK